MCREALQVESYLPTLKCMRTQNMYYVFFPKEMAANSIPQASSGHFCCCHIDNTLLTWIVF